MTELTSQSEEGWCPIETIASFKRMKQITEDLSVVVAALKTSTFLSVSEDGVNIKRVTPLVDAGDTTDRSVYVKGLPEAWELDEIQEFVEKHLIEGETLCRTNIRRFKGGENDKKSKGSAFLELSSVAAVERFVALKIKATEEGEEIKILTKTAYVAAKKEERAKKGGDSESKGGKGKGGKGKGKGGKGNKRKAEDGDEKEKEEKDPTEFPKDMILSLSGLGEECSRENVKEALETLGCNVQFIEYARGSEQGFVRLKENEENSLTASAAAAKITADGVEVAGSKLAASALAGEEETAYWEKVRGAKANKRKKGRR